MARIASDALIERLADWGVDTIFGLPGDGINGIMEGLRRNQDKVRFVLVHHEEAAAFMATAHAKATGKIGVCLATSGPGGIHLLNGLYDAKLDHMPVLAITGMQETSILGTGYQQEVALDKLYEDVTEYDQMIYNPVQLPAVVDIAIRTAYARRGVAHITVPNDIQVADAGADPWQHVAPAAAPKTSAVYLSPPGRPREEDLQRLADFLNEGEKIAILAGAGALHAREELLTLAETLAAPIVKPLLGKGAVPDESPYTTGGIGLLGTAPSEEALEACDTLLLVGTSFPYIEFLPKPGQARGVQIDLDPERIGLRYPVELGVVGDSRTVLRALLPLLERKADRSFLERAQEGMRHWWALLEDRGTRADTPMKPQAVAYELDKLLADDAIVSADCGTNTTWAARYIRLRRGQLFSCSGTLATMACGFPYAIAAQLAYPDRQCVALVGDGGFTMLMGELATVAKYNLPVKIIVLKNNTLGQIKWEQMVFLGNPEYGCELQPVDFAAVAEACGVRGFTIREPGECRATLAEALRHPGPAVVQAEVDPNEPPMPARVKPEQALKLAEALARGEPNRARIGVTLFRDKVRDFLAPGGREDDGVLEKVKDKVRDIVE